MYAIRSYYGIVGIGDHPALAHVGDLDRACGVAEGGLGEKVEGVMRTQERANLKDFRSHGRAPEKGKGEPQIWGSPAWLRIV